MGLTKMEMAKVFTDKVAEYIAQGYVFHTRTMNGSDGTTRIDLIKGTDFIRVFMDTSYGINGHIHFLKVGKKSNVTIHRDIVWADDLEIIEEYEWVVLNRFDRNEYYMTMEEYQQIKEKRKMRENNRYCNRYYTCEKLNNQDKAKEIVLSFMKRQNRCKSIKLKDITSVEKYVSGDRKKPIIGFMQKENIID